MSIKPNAIVVYCYWPRQVKGIVLIRVTVRESNGFRCTVKSFCWTNWKHHSYVSGVFMLICRIPCTQWVKQWQITSLLGMMRNPLKFQGSRLGSLFLRIQAVYGLNTLHRFVICRAVFFYDLHKKNFEMPKNLFNSRST